MKILIKIITLILIITISMLQMSCNDDKKNSDCSNAICTEVFITITVSVKDQNQKAVALDSFKVTNIDNNEDLTISRSASEFEVAQKLGIYPMISDGGIPVNQKINLQFKGFINGLEVISSNYVVSADCCHVNLVSGNISLILE